MSRPEQDFDSVQEARAYASGLTGYFPRSWALQVAALRARELAVLLQAVADQEEDGQLRIAVTEWIADAAILERRISNGSKFGGRAR